MGGVPMDSNPALQIKGLFSLVGAGRFERPTPCAQDVGTALWSITVTYLDSVSCGVIIYICESCL